MKNKFSSQSRLNLLKGVKNSHKSRKTNYETRLSEYSFNPKKCCHCHKNLKWEQRKNKYCSHSCHASVTNIGSRKHGQAPIEKTCSVCSKNTFNKAYCSPVCRAKGAKLKVYEQIENGDYISPLGGKTIRNYLLEKRDHKCEKCLFDKWMDKPINLTVHHDDGDATNNLPANLKLYCWNCHSMTKNFGSKNKNSTRSYRYGNKKD